MGVRVRLVRWGSVTALGLGVAAVPGPVAAEQPVRTERVSVSSTGGQATDDSSEPALSATGRYVAFSSYAPDLVPGDTNGLRDVFVRDRQRGTTRRVSVSTTGGQANGGSGFSVAISASGRHVAFLSEATDLVPGLPPDAPLNVFVHDLRQGTTELVSVAEDGYADGRSGFSLALSASGRYVAFISDATDLVGDDTNQAPDVFLRDRWRGRTERVSVTSAEQQLPSGSAIFDVSVDALGRYVSFTFAEPGRRDEDTGGVGLRDRVRGTTTRVGGTISRQAALSATGRFLAFQTCAEDVVPGDANGQCDVFLTDRLRGTTRLVSVSTEGRQADSLSAAPQVSPDGRFVAYSSQATTLVPGDTNGVGDVFLFDRRTGRTTRASVGAAGEQADAGSFGGAVSLFGGAVAYRSDAEDLVPSDTNAAQDVFVTRR